MKDVFWCLKRFRGFGEAHGKVDTNKIIPQVNRMAHVKNVSNVLNMVAHSSLGTVTSKED